jgi:hypothetical protein
MTSKWFCFSECSWIVCPFKFWNFSTCFFNCNITKYNTKTTSEKNDRKKKNTTECYQNRKLLLQFFCCIEIFETGTCVILQSIFSQHQKVCQSHKHEQSEWEKRTKWISEWRTNWWWKVEMSRKRITKRSANIFWNVDIFVRLAAVRSCCCCKSVNIFWASWISSCCFL